LQFAPRFYERYSRQPPRRSGFGTWAPAAQLSVRSVSQPQRLRSANVKICRNIAHRPSSMLVARLFTKTLTRSFRPPNAAPARTSKRGRAVQYDRALPRAVGSGAPRQRTGARCAAAAPGRKRHGPEPHESGVELPWVRRLTSEHGAAHAARLAHRWLLPCVSIKAVLDRECGASRFQVSRAVALANSRQKLSRRGCVARR
jgi:hypothetical protein